ncbi:MAG: EAL domain-containing protein [Sedimenticolaceae bacterium]
MLKVSPIIRLALGLMLLTVSLLLVSDLLGLTPDQKRAELAARKAISESLAVQVSNDISEARIDAVAETLRVLEERNDRVLSIGLRTSDGRLIAMAGDHVEHWIPAEDGRSTSSHVVVPIHMEDRRWGVLEVSFVPLDGIWASILSGGSIAAVIAFVTFAGFLAYWLFLKRALNELDPSAVVPDRVRAALDVLAEGLVILDRGGRIVLANHAFERKLGQQKTLLVGNSLSSLTWQIGDTKEEAADGDLPWQIMLDSGATPATTQLTLRTARKELLSFAVNCSPVKAPDDSVRGVVVTFDDLTELEHKNADLERAMEKLEHTQREITRQNRELQVLATRDALTGVLNRRSLFDGMATLLSEVADQGEPLSCIMVDIDHFKSINDRFGHATGDKVIKILARTLTQCVRADDLVGRYGGEEFCVIVPGVTEEAAAAIAEKMRRAIYEGRGAKFTSALRISASFGVAATFTGEKLAEVLVDLADKALYQAKERGRNRVVRWSEVEHHTDRAGDEDAGVPTEAVQQTDSDARGAAEGRIQDVELVSTNQRLRDRIAELELLIREQLGEGAVGIDEPTGLPNRIVLIDRIRQGLQRSQRTRSRVAVLSVDVESIALVREAQGIAAADKLMKLVGTRLKKSLRGIDTVAVAGSSDLEASISSGGDGEFTVLLSDMREAESATWIIQRLFGALEAPAEVEGNEIILDASVGVSLSPNDGEDPDTLIANAGAALREAKLAPGRNVCLYFNKKMNERSREQLNMEAKLHRAIEHGELFLEYQPGIDMRTGRIRVFEALLRWRHPDLGMVRPDRFIPIAEHAGLIERIGDWVIQTALLQLKSWHEMGNEDLCVAINFSAFQFRQTDLVERVVAGLQEAQLSASSLVAEITESSLIENLDTAVAIVNGLSEAGVCVALDDFGTGYSSLNYLKRFPIDVVKIDRSFLRDFPTQPNDTEIVSAIIAMAHSLGLRVVAEGVETDRQLQVLQNMQCDEIQGYLFSKPISREHATELLLNPADIRRMVRAASRDGTGSRSDRLTAISGIVNELPKQGFGA